jgi:CBS domain containing-hemolysin-like protein
MQAAYERSDAAEQERVITEALEDLRDMDVREVMTPRLDVAALTIPVHVEDVVQAVRESGHSCFPVVNGGLDDVVGVLYVNDLFRTRRSGRGGLLLEEPPRQPGDATLPERVGPEPAGLTPIDISRRIRQPYVIPESRRILAALVEMRRHRRGFAVVVDEYGGVSGVLTVKDLLEPIVGDLHDELDRVEHEPSILRVDGARWLVDGRANVDDVHEALGIDVPEGEYVTIAGYLFDRLGHIPVVGETIGVDGWELTVQEMDKRRIAMIVARRVEEETVGADDSTAVEQAAGPPHAAPAEAGRRAAVAPASGPPPALN